jgi:pyrimidine-nucleoside phosphorylase
MFRRIIEYQGGDPRTIDDYGRLPSAPDRQTVTASRSGFVGALAAEDIGRAGVALGAGRNTLDDVIDPGVGIDIQAPVGTAVSAGDPVLVVSHRGRRGLDYAWPLLLRAVHIADEPPAVQPLVIERILHG